MPLGRAALQGLADCPVGHRKHAALLREPHWPCEWALRDAKLMPPIQRAWQANMPTGGADKLWRQLGLAGVNVARCTIERLMCKLGLRGVLRGKVAHKTVGDAKAPCQLDRVNRRLRA